MSAYHEELRLTMQTRPISLGWRDSPSGAFWGGAKMAKPRSWVMLIVAIYTSISRQLMIHFARPLLDGHRLTLLALASAVLILVYLALLLGSGPDDAPRGTNITKGARFAFERPWSSGKLYAPTWLMTSSIIPSVPFTSSELGEALKWLTFWPELSVIV